jgi:GGDEF domain-containing protein
MTSAPAPLAARVLTAILLLVGGALAALGAVAGAGTTLAAVGFGLLGAAGVITVVMEVAVLPLSRHRSRRRADTDAQADIEALVVAGIELRGIADLGLAGDRICRIATDLLHATGALLYLQGPGRMLLAGRHGNHPAPVDAEVGGDPAMTASLRDGTIRDHDHVVLPVTGGAGVIGVLTVHGNTRAVCSRTSGALHLFAGLAGGLLDRLGAIESLFDAETRDPVTGVGSRRQASAVVASLRPGDGLVLLCLDKFATLRATAGDAAADLLLGQLGLHLRDGIRPGDAVARFADDQFVLVLRDLKAPVDVVVGRLVESWLSTQPMRTISIGATLHLEGRAPLDTLDQSQVAMASALLRGGGSAAVTPSYVPARVA